MPKDLSHEDVAELRARAHVHDLKTWPGPFAASKAGLKPWELRFNDRDFQVGDTLRLREWSPEAEAYSGDELSRRVAFVLPGGQFGLPSGYVIMSCAPINSLTREGGWRPIESAPKDGETILLSHELATFTGYWQDGTVTQAGNGEGWVTGETDSYEDLIVYQPTHWMPLPPAPGSIASPGSGGGEDHGSVAGSLRDSALPRHDQAGSATPSGESFDAAHGSASCPIGSPAWCAAAQSRIAELEFELKAKANELEITNDVLDRAQPQLADLSRRVEEAEAKLSTAKEALRPFAIEPMPRQGQLEVICRDGIRRDLRDHDFNRAAQALTEIANVG